MIMVDSNVIIDVLEPDPEWHDWSVERLEDAAAAGGFTSYIVAAEVSGRLDSEARLRQSFDALGLPIREMDFGAAHRAGQAYNQWIRNGGRRGAILADLLIGAQAASLGAAVLTRDPRRFRTYFPELELITPETEE